MEFKDTAEVRDYCNQIMIEWTKNHMPAKYEGLEPTNDDYIAIFALLALKDDKKRRQQ